MTYSPTHTRFLALLGLGLLAAGPLAAQTLYSNGGTIFVNTGGALVVNGTAQQAGAATLRTTGTATIGGDLTSAPAATLDLSTGTLSVAGNVAHQGPTAGTTGTLRLAGPAAQSIGLNAGTVPNLTVDKVSGTATLAQPLQVRQVLTMANAGDLALNGQPLTLLSDASGTALVVNSGAGLVTGGTATMQRYLDTPNQGLGYRHYSSPVSGNTLADLTTGTFAPVFNSAYNTSATPGAVSPFPTVFGYDQARLATVTSNIAAFDRGYYSPLATDAMPAGAGFTVNLPGTEKVDFTGTLRTGTYPLALARNSGPTAADAGWQLLGNPYPAPLDYALLTLADRTGLDAALYVFESTSQYAGTYRTYVNGIGTSSLVGAGQGFFTRVSTGQTSATLTFRNGQRLTSYAQQVPVRRGTADVRPQLQLTLGAAGGPTDAFYLYAEAGATDAADTEFDAVKRLNPSGLNLAGLTAAGTALAIDGRPAFSSALVVPLSVGVPQAGSYVFTAPTVANLPAGLSLYLRDFQTGTRTLLAAGTTYAFNLSTTTAPGRFQLEAAAGPLATAPAALAAQVLVYPTPTQGLLTVRRPATGPASADLVDALGRVVRHFSLPSADTTLDLHELPTGVYVLRLTTPEGTVNKRVVRE